ELITKIGSRNSCLRWRPLGEVIRRACRLRASSAGAEELEMYGSELLVENPSDQAFEVRILKRTGQDDFVSEILCNERPITWAIQGEHFVFGERIGPRSGKSFRVVYREQQAHSVRRSLGFEMVVAARRILCEIRDNYLFTSRILSAPTKKLKVRPVR